MDSELGQVAIVVSDWECGEPVSSCKELLSKDWMEAFIGTTGLGWELGWEEKAGCDSEFCGVDVPLSLVRRDLPVL